MSWGGGFADALQGVRDSQQRKALFDLDQRARQAFGQSVQDPNLFQGAVPGAGPMPGSPDMQAYGGGTDMSVPRGIRNNNPGNITDSPWTRRQPGYSGTDGQFARFENRGAGDQAVQSLLQNYATQGINTVGGIISKWAPANENATQDYINFVSKAAGVPPDAPLSPDQRLKVAQAITQFENGIKASAPPPGGMFDQRQPAGMMSQPGVGPDPSRFVTPGFGGGSPPPAGQGGASDGSPPGAPPTGQGAPAGQGGQMGGGAPAGMQAGGLDMSKIIAAVQRANPNAPPEVIGEVVKRFLPILLNERTQGNADRTAATNLDNERRNREVEDRTYRTGREDKAYERRQPVPVQTGVDYVAPETNQIVRSGRERTASGALKLDVGTMKAIRENDDKIASLQNRIKVFDSVLEPDKPGAKALNEKAYEGAFASQRGYVGSLLETKPGAGAATEILSNRISQNAIDGLKQAFGANPTEGERAVLLDLAGASSKSATVRREIYARARTLAKERLARTQRETEEMRGGTYYKPGSGAPSGGGGGGEDPLGLR